MLLPVKVDSKQGLIQWNFDELRLALTTELKRFDNLIVSEDEIKDFEQIRANLNKVSKLIDDERKRVKKEYSEPLTKFETEVKSLVSLITDVNSKIDVQLKSFEEIRKEEKLEIVRQVFDELFIYKKTVDLEKIFKDSWLNKTISVKQITQEILDWNDKIKNDIEIISDLKSGNDGQILLNFYLECLDVPMANNRFKAFTEGLSKVGGITIPKQEKSHSEPENEPQEIITIKFTVKSTRSKLLELSNYLERENIEWETTE